jgi:hypothetical protein
MVGLGLNSAEEQRSFDLIPDGTIVEVQLNIRPGHIGEGGLLKRAETTKGVSQQLDCEFIVTQEGEHFKRKFWSRMTMEGGGDGHAKAAEITRRTLRAMFESAHGINPKDTTEAAVKARNAVNLTDFQGMRFMVKVGIKKGDPKPGGGEYDPKNIISRVITPDQIEWHAVVQDVSKDAPLDGNARGSVMVAPASDDDRPDWAH